MVQKTVFVLFSLLFLTSGDLPAQDSWQRNPDFLPVSAWYSGGQARAPMLSTITPASRREWSRDLAQIKSLGFNTVRTWVEWAHCEPQPGEYRYDNLELLCELAQEHNLRVIIQMYIDSAPDWVARRFPDGLFEAQSGDKVVPQSAPGCCTDHPGVREAVMNFFTETARVAVRYPNFYGWDLWSEPHIINWAYINYVPNATFCYCPHTMKAFQLWLLKKYGTLEALNRAWYRNFTDWSEVSAPRFGTILSYTDFIDWKNFIYAKLAKDLRLRYEAIRKADPSHVVTSHAAVPSIFYSPYVGAGATDDFLMAEQIDYYGTSLYPKHNHPRSHWETWKFQVAVDFSRSANKRNGGFYVGELQAGKGTYGLNIGNPITPGDHRLWMWSAIAKGAKAINIYAYYPMSSGYESGGYGLINLDGSLTERAIAAGKTARTVTDNMELLLESRDVAAQVAVVYNPLAQMVGGEQRTVTGDMHLQSLLGYYRFLTERNIPMDFIHRRDLELNEPLPYKLIIVPYPLMFTQQAADGLKRFIADGGCVLSEARLAWNDERGFAAPAIPGMGLDQVFGVRETSVRMGERIAMSIADTSHPLAAGLSQADTLYGANFAESLELLADRPGTVLATFADGTAALTVSPYGKGKGVTVGSFLGMANHLQAAESNNRFLENLVGWTEIERPLTTSHDGIADSPIEVRMRQTSQRRILFILNFGQEEQEVSVVTEVDHDRNYRLQELVGGRNQSLTARDKSLTLQTSIAGRDAQVWIVE
ncbi:beta-galactosidase [candidate division KSB1 bacterium]|nr:beta-galactosidase [candidate division KSB1 bacterium]